ncbi:MAG: FtsX-like permease family protein [Ignavibacteriales bacterium]|jgi:putative ABC transport system permease protein|nr:ABC transporter permease [Melioribacteraceae bacterium]RJP62186.1 MAG: FtsX-like permease family protein [Ignavibacteriales bacterium]
MGQYLFELKESLLISFRAIRVNKIRSILTTLGIVIGVTSVVLMSTALKGMDIAFQDGVAALGSDNLYIDKWSWFDNNIPWWEVRNRKNLDLDEFKQYESLAKLPEAVAPTVWTNQTLKFKDNTLNFNMITGTNHNYIKTTNLEFAEGRFFTELESNSARNVVVIGSSVAESLFPRGGGLNEFIKIKGRKFKVIGILAQQGSFIMGNFNPDNQAFVPIDVVFKYFHRSDFRSITFNVRAKNNALVQDTKDEAISLMRKIRGLSYADENDFSINQQEGLLNNINQTTSVIKIAGYFITGLALFVGAIGIMNIMFVSVKERTREIGIRKAIGAKRRTVLGQFLFESSIICLMGGFVGLAIAVLLSMVVNQFLPTSVQVDAVILAIVISVLTGVISGLAPAYTAAKMDPVDALRYE